MFFPYTNYKRINVPRIPGLGGTTTQIWTTEAKCIMYFEMNPADIRFDKGWRISVSHVDYFNDNRVICSGWPQVNEGAFICPAGKDIYAYFNDTFDLIGGTLHVFELPE